MPITLALFGTTAAGQDKATKTQNRLEHYSIGPGRDSRTAAAQRLPLIVAGMVLAESRAPDFPCFRLGQALQELDGARIFVWRNRFLDEFLDGGCSIGVCVVRTSQHDERLRDLAPRRIGNGHNCALANAWMF